jgi:hypothetical protein
VKDSSRDRDDRASGKGASVDSDFWRLLVIGLKAKSAEHGFLLCLILGFVAIRLIWLVRLYGEIDGFLDGAEALQIALTIARHGMIGDAYYIGQGPTAHLLPLNPLLAGGVMWLLGPGSSAANLALLGLSLGQVLSGYLLIRLVFVRLGADPRAVRWGTALLLLVPPFVPQETIDFRYWEGASALCLVSLNMLAMIALDRRSRLRRGDLAAIPALFALTFFVLPPAGVAIGACWAIVALRRLPLASSMALAGATVAALALVIAPWALRNAQVMGEPILLRSNMGIELALANHPAAVSGEAPEYVFNERLHAIHPGANAAARAAVRANGEAAYSRALADETRAWISANPLAFARLYARHVSEIIAPRPWQMYFTGWEGARVARAGTIAVVQLIGLVGLAMTLLARRPRAWIPAVYIGIVVLLYGSFQPMPRYGFIIYPFLCFPAVEAIAIAVARFGRWRGSAPDSTDRTCFTKRDETTG